MTYFGAEFCPNFYICLFHSSDLILEQKTFNFFTVTRHLHLWDLLCLCSDDKPVKPQCELASIRTTAQLGRITIYMPKTKLKCSWLDFTLFWSAVLSSSPHCVF